MHLRVLRAMKRVKFIYNFEKQKHLGPKTYFSTLKIYTATIVETLITRYQPVQPHIPDYNTINPLTSWSWNFTFKF